MKGALDVHRDLLDRDVPHEVVRLPGRLLHADDLPRLLELDRGCVTVRCYVVERAAGTSFAAVLLPAGAVPSPGLLLEALDACSVSPARPEHVNAATDFAAGLVCPAGLPPDVEVLADTAVAQEPTSYCALGEGGVALGIRTPDLLGVSGARPVPLTSSDLARVIDLEPAVDLRPPPRPAPRPASGPAT